MRFNCHFNGVRFTTSFLNIYWLYFQDIVIQYSCEIAAYMSYRDLFSELLLIESFMYTQYGVFE